MVTDLQQTIDAWTVVFCALALGSFGNVFLARFPEGKSLWKPPSQCPHCGHSIRWKHNIPVLGWFLLRGRCADCGERISFRYPAMEASFGILAWAHVACFGVSFESLYYLGFLLALLLVAWVDWETQYIFDVVSLPMLAAGVLASLLFPRHYLGAWDSAAAAAAMALFMLALGALGRWKAGRDALGGGDLKLMAASAAFLGLSQAWKALALGVLLGLPLMLLYLKLRKAHWKEPAPFGPGLCLGSALALVNMLSGGALDPSLARLGLDLLAFHSNF
jgi:leader peptidase (prepilin peptidase)/N-methyltransferase